MSMLIDVENINMIRWVSRCRPNERVRITYVEHDPSSLDALVHFRACNAEWNMVTAGWRTSPERVAHETDFLRRYRRYDGRAPSDPYGKDAEASARLQSALRDPEPE